MSLPREPAMDAPLSRGWGLQIQRHLAGLRKQGKTVRTVPLPRSLFNIRHPFKITDASDETGAKIRVQWGLVNDLEPTLDDDTTPLSDIPEIALSPTATTGTWVVLIEVKNEDDESKELPDIDHVWVIAIKDWTLAGMGDNPDIFGYQIIGEVDVEAGDAGPPETFDRVVDIRQNVTHGLRYRICGRIAEDTEAVPPTTFAPGTHQFWGI